MNTLMRYSPSASLLGSSAAVAAAAAVAHHAAAANANAIAFAAAAAAASVHGSPNSSGSFGQASVGK